MKLPFDPVPGAVRYQVGIVVERSRMVHRPWWAFWTRKIRVIEAGRFREVSVIPVRRKAP